MLKIHLLIHVQCRNEWYSYRSSDEGKTAGERQKKVPDSEGGRISAGWGYSIFNMMGQLEERLSHK